MAWSGAPRRRLTRLGCAVAAVALLVAPAFGADAPPLPASAKRLDDAGIAALYDGKTFSFKSFTFYGVVTGEVTYDFTTKTNHGTYELGSRHGSFDGTIRVFGDKFCYLAGYNNERCNYVYIDGDDIYEVRQSGVVESVKQVPQSPVLK